MEGTLVLGSQGRLDQDSDEEKAYNGTRILINSDHTPLLANTEDNALSGHLLLKHVPRDSFLQVPHPHSECTSTKTNSSRLSDYHGEHNSDYALERALGSEWLSFGCLSERPNAFDLVNRLTARTWISANILTLERKTK